MDLKFFELDVLVALIYRDADNSWSETLQWFAFIPLKEALFNMSEIDITAVTQDSSTTLADYLLKSVKISQNSNVFFA